MGKQHADLLGNENHAVTANPNSTGASYADITARDADTDFNSDAANVNKVVRVESPLSFFILAAITPTWVEFSSTQTDSFIEHADTPSDFSGQGGLVLQVNSAEDAVEFGQDLTITGTPTLASLTVSGNLTVDTNTLFVDSADNMVGIGSAAPLANLHVVTSGTSGFGGVPSTRGIAITGLGGFARLFFEATDATAGERVFEINNDAGVLRFAALNDTAGAFIHQFILTLEHDTGFVGIGTNTPATELDVSGDVTISGTLNAAAGVITGGVSNVSLDLTSVTAALRLNRLTVTQRNALTALAGMTIFNTTDATAQVFDGSIWITMVADGDVLRVGTPVDDQLAIWTGTNTIEGDANLTFDGVQLKLLDGTELLPAYSFLSDPDTGMRRSAANVLNFSARGFDVLQLTAEASANTFLTVTAVDNSIFEDTPVLITPDGTESVIELNVEAKGSGVLNLGNTLIAGTVSIGRASRLTVAPLIVFTGPSSFSPVASGGRALAIQAEVLEPITKFSIFETGLGGELAIGLGDATEDSGAAFFRAEDSTEVRIATSAGTAISISGLAIVSPLKLSNQLSFLDESTQVEGHVPDGFGWHVETALFKQSFNVTSEQSVPTDLFFKPDGLKMYVIGENEDFVHEYDLSIAWDISTAVVLQSFGFNAQEPSGQAVFIRPDGLKMYIQGNIGDDVNEYDLGTAWDISTAVFLQVSADFDAQNTNNVGMWFKPDGLKLYITGSQSGDKSVDEYDLTTAWDVSTIAFNQTFVFANQSNNSFNAMIRNDGRRMYVCFVVAQVIEEFILTTPWDISTAVPNQTLDVSSEDTVPRGVCLRPDGTKLYFMGRVAESVFEYDLGIQVEGNFSDGTNVGKLSFNPANIVEIRSASDLTSLDIDGVVSVSGSVVTITGILALRFKAQVVTNLEFVLVSGSSLVMTGDGNNTTGIVYTGTGTFVSGTGLCRFIDYIVLVSVGADTQFIDLVSPDAFAFLIFDASIVVGWNSMGSFSDGNLLMTTFTMRNIGGGWALTDLTSFAAIVVNQDITSAGTALSVPLFALDSKLAATDVSFRDLTTALTATGSVLDLSTKIDSAARIGVTAVTTTVGNLFKPSTLTDATINSIADNSPSTGTITAMADNSALGTTVSSTTTYFDGEEVTITGTTSYNGTFKAFNVVAGVSFDISVEFVADDATGSVDSVRLDLTLAGGHGIVALDDLKIIDTNFYNGFVTALDVNTNVLTVNGVFVQTDTGSIERELSLDQTDPRVLALNNFGIANSQLIACAHVNDNSTANGSITNNTFTDMVFGTTGSALIASSTMERWKMVDELNGTFEFIGNEPFDGLITFDFTVESSGGIVDFRFKWEQSTDGGSTFNDLADAVEALVAVGSDSLSVTKTFPLAVAKGDQIRPQITRNSGTSGITTTYATIYATQ